MASIKHLMLPEGWNSIVDERIMHHLLFRPNLELAHLRGRFPWGAIEKLQSNIPIGGLFPRLRSLESSAAEKVLQSVLPGLRHLQTIDVESITGGVQQPCYALDYLSSCPRLESVALRSLSVIPAKTFLHIASGCPLMRLFHVNTLSWAHENSGITDEVMDRLASSWRQLEVFTLKIRCPRLSVKSLVSFSRHCPRLFDLDLRARFGLVQLNDEPQEVNFPALQRIRLGGYTLLSLQSERDVAIAYEQIVAVFEVRFPILLGFSQRNQNNDFERELIYRIGRCFLRRGACRRELPKPSRMMARRLVEPVPGSRYNPLT